MIRWNTKKNHSLFNLQAIHTQNRSWLVGVCWKVTQDSSYEQVSLQQCTAKSKLEHKDFANWILKIITWVFFLYSRSLVCLVFAYVRSVWASYEHIYAPKSLSLSFSSSSRHILRMEFLIKYLFLINKETQFKIINVK